MSKSLQSQAAAVLYDGETGERFVDLRIDLREWGDSRTNILQVGGRWDRAERCWVGDGDVGVVWRVHPGQYEAAYFFADWYRAYVADRRVVGWEDVYVMLVDGGRGAGKSDLGVRACAMVAAGMANRITWMVSPVEDETKELQRVVEAIMPASWYHWNRSELTYYMWNGSTISMLSGYDPGTLKRGRVDFWLLNEAQRFPKEAYKMIRPRLADTGGLGYMAANPPRDEKGQWVMDFHDQAKARELPGVRLVEMDAQKNPTIDYRSLEVLRPEFGEDDFRREILGEMLPVGDRVFYAWSDMGPAGNIRPRPDVGCITRAFTKRWLGRELDYLVGVDFQLAPHMPAVVAEVFHNPDDPDNPLLWFTDEVVVKGNEDALVDALEEVRDAAGNQLYLADRCAVVCDASGWWQDAERQKGRGSVDMLRARGWRWVFRPDRDAKKNPEIVERVQASNARFCAADRARRCFSVPENVQLNRALKFWENRNGAPYRRSEFAHLCDAATYLLWRFWPRRLRRTAFAYEGGARVKSDRESELDGIV